MRGMTRAFPILAALSPQLWPYSAAQHMLQRLRQLIFWRPNFQASWSKVLFVAENTSPWALIENKLQFWKRRDWCASISLVGGRHFTSQAAFTHNVLTSRKGTISVSARQRHESTLHLLLHSRVSWNAGQPSLGLCWLGGTVLCGFNNCHVTHQGSQSLYQVI